MNTISLAAKDAIYNLGMNIGSIPTKVELGLKSSSKKSKSTTCDKEREELLSSLRKQVKRDQEELSRMKKSAERKAAETKAAEKFIKNNAKKDNNIQEVSDALKIREKKAEEQKAKASVIKLTKAEITKKWLDYAIYYMSTPDAQLLKLTKSQEGLVNGIAKYFGIGKIYEDAKISDIETFDKSFDKYDEFSRYEISIINDIIPLLEDKEFMKKVEIRKQQLSSAKVKETAKSETTKAAEEVKVEAKPATIVKEVKEETKVEAKTETIAEETKVVEVNEIIEEEIQEEAENNLDLSSKEEKDIREVIHPISFEVLKDEETTNKKEAVKVTNSKLPAKLFKRLENIFVPLIGKKNHKYEIDGDFINIHIYKKGNKKETYIIDPGVCMGKGKIYILANVPTDTIFVSTEHKDIIRKVLSDKEYVLNPSEIQKVIQDYFRNMNIYRYIDMNKTEFLSKINEEDFQKLGKKLTFIINQKINNECRFRFLNWESVDRFTIISDSSVKSPLSSTGETSNKINEGLTYIVEGDNITQKMGDKINMLQIQQYGDM